MPRAILTLLIVSTLSILAQALEGPKYRFPHLWENRDESEPYAKPQLDIIHEYVTGNLHNCTYTLDPDYPEEHQPIRMTKDLYKSTFVYSKPETPWFIVFLHTFRYPGYEQFTQNDFVMNTMKVLADEYQGRIRFAFIAADEEEEMSESFGVRALPTDFFFKDGFVYELNPMSVGYMPIRKFIEEGHLEGSNSYQIFRTPQWIYNSVTLKFRYLYNAIYRQLIEKGHYKKIIDGLKKIKITETKSAYSYLGGDKFFQSVQGYELTNYVILSVLSAVLIGTGLTILATYCICFCLCRKRDAKTAKTQDQKAKDE